MFLPFSVWFFLGLSLASAVLLGAVLAPTDPVLADDVQVGPPGENDESEVHFALTSEAGCNDGMAFPFVNLAIVIAVTGVSGASLGEWALVDVIWKIGAGFIVGVAIGRLVAVLIFRLCSPSAIGDGFIAVALTLLTYGQSSRSSGSVVSEHFIIWLMA